MSLLHYTGTSPRAQETDLFPLKTRILQLARCISEHFLFLCGRQSESKQRRIPLFPFECYEKYSL